MEKPTYNQQGKPSRERDWKANPNWVTDPKGLPPEAIDFAEDFGKHLASPFWNEKAQKVTVGRNAMTTTQLRNFFGELRRIQAMGFEGNETDFYMLKPKLAYTCARELKNKKDNRIGDFEKALRPLIEAVAKSGKAKSFTNFTKFVEAIVAFHKYHGGE